jgi:hypothetical protein
VTRPREQLIRELAQDLAPAPRLAPAGAAALGWLALAALAVAAITVATGPLRPGVAGQLLGEPRFLLNVLLGLAAAALAIRGVMRLRIPGGASGARGAAPALLGLGAWLGLQTLGVFLGDPSASSLGGRPACFLQVLAFSLLPLAGALWLARRAAPLERAWTGLLAGAAAGALGALSMQLACKHEPLHSLLAHLLPLLAVAAAGAWLGRRLLPRV